MKQPLWNNRIIQWLAGFAGAMVMFDTLAVTDTTARGQVAGSYSFLAFVFCIFSAFAYEKICDKTKKKNLWDLCVSGGFALFLSVALVVGSRLETVENFNVGEIKAWISTVLLTVYFVPMVQYLWEQVALISWEKEVCEKNNFLRNWVLIFACWIPVFLAFYPGAFVYDAQDEYVQVATRSFTTHHPLVHVLLLGGMVCAGNKFFGSYNVGIALYTLFQMLVLSGVFSYTIEYVKKRIKWKNAEKIALTFYGLFPVISMYAVCSAKDGLFTAAFLVVIIKMLQFFENPEKFCEKKGNLVASILAAVAMMLFRNNGMYAYVVWLPLVAMGIFILTKQKKYSIVITCVMAGSVLAFLVSAKILAAVLGASDVESQEIMTVPIQQMVRTYVYSPDTYTEEEKEILFEIIPEEDMKLYNPRLSDLVKSKFNNTNFNANKGKYLALWLKTGMRKPLIYLNAWFMTSYGYWYPDAVINVYGGNTVHTFTYQDSSYFGFETENPGIRESKFPWLEEQFRKMSLELYQHKLPGVSMLFSPGFMFWVYAFIVCFLVWKKKWNRVLGMSGILLLWLTVILGPTYLVRYVLILWFAMPVIVSELKS